MDNQHEHENITKPQNPSSYTKISTTILTTLYLQLLPHLRSPLSRTVEGKPDKGAIANWITEQAHTYLTSYNSTQMMKEFIIEQELTEEFHRFVAARNPSMFSELL